ncbi:hypothetical protein FLW53_28450 [Microbispora sp. SCL1-1]|uniref:hypothetical protein n=1 Tax=unclassified Microbispora TaxID=2614687 RepID=UPI001156C845|nr:MULTISPECIES: hypothetical protein [unclassified Microbispora]NJP28061.1 hypothetical protein [Microbispora sp. CL1-1]TQS09423.1 hypothetical protein FLW53_28450 [Microbispora sp. SCL1-1]
MDADRRRAFIESLTADEARMFATYVAGLAPRSFAVAASLVERDRVAFGHGLAAVHAPLSTPQAACTPAPVVVPPGVTPLYDWAAEGDFPPVADRVEAGDEQRVEDAPNEPSAGDGGPGYVPEALAEDLARQATSRFLADVMTGEVPGVRRIKTELNIGQDKAQQVRAYLSLLAES